MNRNILILPIIILTMQLCTMKNEKIEETKGNKNLTGNIENVDIKFHSMEYEIYLKHKDWCNVNKINVNLIVSNHAKESCVFTIPTCKDKCDVMDSLRYAPMFGNIKKEKELSLIGYNENYLLEGNKTDTIKFILYYRVVSSSIRKVNREISSLKDSSLTFNLPILFEDSDNVLIVKLGFNDSIKYNYIIDYDYVEDVDTSDNYNPNKPAV